MSGLRRRLGSSLLRGCFGIGPPAGTRCSSGGAAAVVPPAAPRHGAPADQASATRGAGEASGTGSTRTGKKIRGAEKHAQCIDAPRVESTNPLRTPSIESENVHKVYDTIADHWSHTRYKAWPRVESFLRRLPPGALVADLGCGNGKNLPAIREAGAFAIASDISAPLVHLSAESHSGAASLLVADCLAMPLRGGIFDAAISIAVLHHLSTEARRVQALREGARLLREGGELLVYCWSYEQDAERSASRHRFDSQDVLVPWSHRTPGIRKARKPEAAAETGDGESNPAGQAQWENTLQVCQRYCHVYREGELLGLLEQVPELELVDHYFDTGNWCAVARRLP